jgi:hypothetical protein
VNPDTIHGGASEDQSYLIVISWMSQVDQNPSVHQLYRRSINILASKRNSMRFPGKIGTLLAR